MPLSPSLTKSLAEKGQDAVHVHQVALDRSSDEAIMEYARAEQRVVITADLDYPRILALTQAGGPGLILFRGGNYNERETSDRLARALEAVPMDELPTSIVVIEKGRIRRRRLPLRPNP